MADTADNFTNFNVKSNIIYSKVTTAGKDKYIGLKITNLNELKKATPRLKLPSILSPTIRKSTSVPKEIKQKLQKYCRTCAGLKVPLIDIFGDKGSQMRLLQQIQHLEDINKDDSLSTQMCMDCIYDMKISYKFFMQIKKAEIKLKSICDSFNTVQSKPALENVENETDIEAEKSSPIVLDNLTSEKDEIDLNDKDDDSEGSFETHKPEIYENFEPCNNSEDGHNEEIESIGVEDEEKKEIVQPKVFKDKFLSDKNIIYKYNESKSAYVQIKVDKNTHLKPEQEKSTSENNIKKELNNSGHSRIPNILKRKLSNGKSDNETKEKISKASLKKITRDLKVKIPNLNLQNSVNVKTEEDGVMYVTAKGSNPNEMLLIKVKKVDKPLEKKTDKGNVKKKSGATTALKPFLKFEDQNETDIDGKIEEYKKKRVQFLGDIDNKPNKDLKVKVANKNNSEIIKVEIKQEEIEIKEENEDENSFHGFSEPVSPSQNDQSSKTSKLKLKDIKIQPIELTKKVTEDVFNFNKLKSILKQKNEYIIEFINYLKQRKITLSRLQDRDIIYLYETKNNVVLDHQVLNEESTEELQGDYTCDFCFRAFSTPELESEHSKIHEVRITHYCGDCDQEFQTNKAKRVHNGTCVQKVICKYCDKVLDSKGKKRQHEQKHNDDQHGQLCDRCGEKFKHTGTLDQHVKSRHMQLEKIFKCPQCPKRFAFRTKLTFHLKTVHTACREFLCEDCGSDFKNPASLRHHRIRKHQNTNNRKECPECKKSVPVYSMSKHMHTHKDYTIACAHCDKKFKNTSTLKQHLRIHEDQRQYKCDTCGVGFNRRDGLRLHLRVHEKPHSRSLKECSCQVCGDKFPNHSMLVIHRNRTHKDGRNFTCHICNRSMMSLRSLEYHLAHIHNEELPESMKEASSIDAETRRVVCLHCNKTFKTEMILRTHVRNTHVEKEPMKCLDCEEMFTSEVRLKHHMMVQHDRIEGTYPCPHCPKRFVNQLRLKTHMISHSDERPHTCETCGFMLKTKIQLIKHKQNRHSNERPLQCRYCEHTCKQVSALVCHERTHTNERPYSCSVCNQRFKYLGDKNKHERRHESLGGSGFKRIVTGRNKAKNKNKSKEAVEQGSELDQEQEQEQELEDELNKLEHGEEEYTVQRNDADSLTETPMLRLKDGQIITDSSKASFGQIIVGDASQDNAEVVVGIQEGNVYTEEVSSDHMEPHIITHDMLSESVLQPGTVIQIQQQDETGEIKMIPFMLSVADLANVGQINLTPASITYN